MWKRIAPWLGIALTSALAGGCATRCSEPANTRPFALGQDTMAYRNELLWDHEFDDQAGKTRRYERVQEPNYFLHCFVMTRSARQFFQFAEFRPDLPVVSDKEYRRLIRRAVSRDPMHCGPVARVSIPGYTNLHHFSRHKPTLLREECGSEWRSYFQRGHWRMVFPFPRAGQEKEALALKRAIENHRPPVVHVMRFPELSINHAMLLFAVHERPDAIEFSTYDPNEPQRVILLTYMRNKRTFHLPRLRDFAGGPVNVYEVYRAWNY
jgi:hypothetical protein